MKKMLLCVVIVAFLSGCANEASKTQDAGNVNIEAKVETNE